MAYRHSCLLIAGLTEEKKLYKLKLKGADKWNIDTAIHGRFIINMGTGVYTV